MEPAVAPLDEDALRAAVTAPGGAWARLDLVADIGSTNADLLAAAATGAPDRTVLVAEHQRAGRGRLTRTWSSPPGSGLAFSVLLRPAGVPRPRLGWLPLLAGLALVDAVGELTATPCGLKWPNDLLLGPGWGKAAGILAEVADPGGDRPAVVVGIGVNVAAAPSDQPAATCLAAGHPEVDRAVVLVTVLRHLAEREAHWRAQAGDPDRSGLRADYRAACRSLGGPVRITLPDGRTLDGTAEDVDTDGRLLLVRPDGRRHAVAAGDVTHVRPAP